MCGRGGVGGLATTTAFQGRSQDLGGVGQDFFFEIWKFATDKS